MDLYGKRFLAFDADNHYYETLDTFTRHLDKQFRRRGVQIVQANDRPMVLIGERVSRFIPNPTFDPVLRPGSLDPYFRGEIPEDVDPDELRVVEPIQEASRDRDSRLKEMDSQGLAAILLFPTMGCGVEQALRGDVPATMATVKAFNRWLEDDWGFNYEGRIFGAPIISFANVAEAVKEIDYALERGARVVCVRPAPVPGENGQPARSLGDPAHDPIWARLAEAGVPVAFHLSDSGYTAISALWGGPPDFDPFHIDPFTKLVISDRAIHDTIGSLIVHGVFNRHPKLKIASIENGGQWVPLLKKRLKKLANQQPKHFTYDPVAQLLEHVWVAPYFEDDARDLADHIGEDKVLFGSDWPHGEGLEQPTDYTKELGDFDDAGVANVMRDNVLALLGMTVADIPS
jgi:predicted TIM-barrel fold metal-dependent hydrolase